MNIYEKELNKKLQELKKKVNKAWEYLNEQEIYTETELKKVIEETQLDIGIFTMPYEETI